MKAIFGLVVFMLVNICASAQAQDTIAINGAKFLFIKINKANADYPGYPDDTLVNVYRIENTNKRYLLQHRLYSKASDCNNTFTDKGSYKIQGDTITFITDLLQERNDPIPRKHTQVYKVDAKGKVILLSDITIEHDGSVVNNMK